MNRARLLLLLAAVTLVGCGDDSNQSYYSGVVGSLPAVYLLAVGCLWVFEKIRNLPDRGVGPIGKGVGITAGVLAALSTVVFFTLPDRKPGMITLAVILLGALGLVAALITWRARLSASYASRVLRAALAAVALWLPAYVLAYLPDSTVGDKYINLIKLGAILGGLYVSPLVVVGLLIETAIRRRK